MKMFNFFNKILSNFFIFLIKGYKLFLSPYLPNSCRFTPTCSQYGIEALQKYGFVKGFILLLKRLFKCHPWGKSGFDPVP